MVASTPSIPAFPNTDAHRAASMPDPMPVATPAHSDAGTSCSAPAYAMAAKYSSVPAEVSAGAPRRAARLLAFPIAASGFRANSARVAAKAMVDDR